MAVFEHDDVKIMWNAMLETLRGCAWYKLGSVYACHVISGYLITRRCELISIPARLSLPFLALRQVIEMV